MDIDLMLAAIDAERDRDAARLRIRRLARRSAAAPPRPRARGVARRLAALRRRLAPSAALPVPEPDP
jgi:hypothetical protein